MSRDQRRRHARVPYPGEGGATICSIAALRTRYTISARACRHSRTSSRRPSRTGVDFTIGPSAMRRHAVPTSPHVSSRSNRTGLHSFLAKRRFSSCSCCSWLPFVVRSRCRSAQPTFTDGSSSRPRTLSSSWTARTSSSFVTVYVGPSRSQQWRRNALQIYLSKPLTRAGSLGEIAILMTFLLDCDLSLQLLLLFVQFRLQTTSVSFSTISICSRRDPVLVHSLVDQRRSALSSLSNSDRFIGIKCMQTSSSVSRSSAS